MCYLLELNFRCIASVHKVCMTKPSFSCVMEFPAELYLVQEIFLWTISIFTYMSTEKTGYTAVYR